MIPKVGTRWKARDGRVLRVKAVHVPGVRLKMRQVAKSGRQPFRQRISATRTTHAFFPRWIEEI